ncbi:MAG: FecR domain-containing protein [Deltaproteobacteria bacterium]|nr:FecR domain-containing protein [Deltaproteobacteria bacterium]
MKLGGKKTFVIAVAVLAALFIAVNISFSKGGTDVDKLLETFKKEYTPPKPLLPPYVQVKPGFKVGEGTPIGKIQMVQGEALVVHTGRPFAYSLKKDFPVFTGDTLVTGKRSRVSVRLNDRSAFALAPVSKLVIDKSIYDPAKKKRSSLLSLWFGRARFVVAKIMGEKKTDYKVKTPTAVCGVRGSDFGLAVAPIEEKTSSLRNFFASLSPVSIAHAQAPGTLVTVVVAGKNTTLTFAGVTGPIQTVVPNSMCAAAAAKGATAVTTLASSIVQGILNQIAAQLAAVSMPPGMD